jgi:hypothetical protein
MASTENTADDQYDAIDDVFDDALNDTLVSDRIKVAEHINDCRQQLAADEAKISRILNIKAKVLDMLTHEEKIAIVPVLMREIDAEIRRRERMKQN